MPLEPGAAFAGFRIVRSLGAGGMGEVYLAEHPRLPRQEALKVLSETYTNNDEYRQRFQREAELAASLWHPHLVALHDRGEDKGRLWISMDYIDGSDMARLVKSKYPAGMPVGETVTVITAIASALDYAHSRGMLHRDVKPSNILVSQSPVGEQRIALADFGIARAMDDVAGLTATNFTLGTVEYAAPEQLMGQQVDARADQYALAATAFHLLSGAAPFGNSNPVAVISQHLTQPPPSIGRIRPELVVLDELFARAMAKEPGERFSSCGEFATALKALAAGIAATPQSATVAAPAPAQPIPARPEKLAAAPLPQIAPDAPTMAAPVSSAVPARAEPIGSEPAPGKARASSLALALKSAVAILAVLLTAATAFAVHSYGQAARYPDDRPAAWPPYRDAAPEFVKTMVALDYRTVDADMQRILDSTTGELRSTFESGIPRLKESIRNSKAVVTVNVKETAVEELRAAEADVLVTAIRTTTLDGVAKEPEPLRLRMTLNEVTAGVIKGSRMEIIK